MSQDTSGFGRSTIARLLVSLLLLAPSHAAANGFFLNPTMVLAPPKGAQRICQDYSWACEGRGAGALAPAKEMALVKQVNRKINSEVRAVSDSSQYRRSEFWTLPTKRGGDCEDFALLKKRELMRLGVDPRKLLIATAMTRKREPHAVLIYRSSQGDLLLDNLTNRIVDWRKSGYVFLRMQDPDNPSRWVGGFKPS